MDITFLSNAIAKYSFVIAIAIIIFYFIYKFLLKPKNPVTTAQVQDTVQAHPLKTEISDDTAVKRMARGFKVMGLKIKESSIVKGLQEEQETATAQDFLPPELTAVNKKSKDKKQSNPFATDLSKLGECDF
jgi:hypothetical protein